MKLKQFLIKIIDFRKRRRLKKLRKDKIRQMTSIDDPNAKRHKHKHKCGDELCKHRKHKKRRKHKKHHHRNETNVIDDPSNELITKSEDNLDNEEDFDEDDEIESGDSHETVKPAESTTDNTNAKPAAVKNDITKNVNLKINKITWPLDEVSSITDDSSGSSYVSE